MPGTIQAMAATARIDPIILEDANDHVATELWRWLCRGQTDGWRQEVGRLGLGHKSFDQMANAWIQGLSRTRAQPEDRDEATEILSRLNAHRVQVAEHRTRYRYISPEVARHRYWPTGVREGMERENLYTMNLCPRRHPFINRQTRIAAAGNCFAMNMGRCLKNWGYDYFIKQPGPTGMSEEELWRRKYGHYSARQGILFNVPSLRQWVERGLGLVELKPYLYFQDGNWHDPYRESVPFDSPEEYATELPEFLSALRETLLETEVLMLAPSCCEVWRFKHDGTYLSRVPWRMSPALLDRQVLSVEDNLNELQRLRDVLTEHNPGIQIIMTVSPVPLLATFRSEDVNVVVSDCLAKATLRVAAEEFAKRNDNVTYFPAYEAVMIGSKVPFAEDGRHVHPDAIDRTMTVFRDTFCAE